MNQTWLIVFASIGATCLIAWLSFVFLLVASWFLDYLTRNYDWCKYYQHRYDKLLRLVDDLYPILKHGDETHQQWLKDMLKAHFGKLDD